MAEEIQEEPTQEEPPELTMTEDLAEQLQEEEPAEEPAAEEATEEVTEEVVEEEPAAEAPKYSEEDLDRASKLAAWIEKNPDVYEQLLDIEQKGFEEPQVEPAEQEWVDPDERITRLEGQIKALTDEITGRGKSEFVVAFEDASESFRESHPELDPEEVAELWSDVREFDLLSGLSKKYKGRPSKGMTTALEMAYRNKYFDQVQQMREPKPPNVKEIRTRRAAASAAPSGASAPRIEPEPETQAERLQAMSRDLKEAMEQ